VLKGSSAEKAGIRAGDVIVRIDDVRVATPADISGRLRMVHGKPVSVALMRDHKELTISVTIADDDPGRIQLTPLQINPN
jgi:S1-C subfamily serine protease